MLILPFVTEGISVKDGFSHYANEPYSFYIWKVPLSFYLFIYFLKQGLNVSHKWILPNCFSEKINESFLALATKGCIQRKT